MKTESAMMVRNPAEGELGFRIVHFENDKHFNKVQRIPWFGKPISGQDRLPMPLATLPLG
ncbi:hypothetical protein [Mucilaginibacter sp. OK098]|uniref:hypothetical protein n=1 Tax=Mucilaginibacter sp. OK098 TaxID=1855297 RepID=UPI000914A246|nr:hypothetical protein [Mucilaginibacter sp. OK098]SHM76759.1 hypothetical protein SAMN05216524_103339 [Mucilaginibacter sp. OK098]